MSTKELTTSEINERQLQEMLALKDAGRLEAGHSWKSGDFSDPDIRPEWVKNWLSDINDDL